MLSFPHPADLEPRAAVTSSGPSNKTQERGDINLTVLWGYWSADLADATPKKPLHHQSQPRERSWFRLDSVRCQKSATISPTFRTSNLASARILELAK